jgi:hypothetical protein
MIGALNSALLNLMGNIFITFHQKQGNSWIVYICYRCIIYKYHKVPQWLSDKSRACMLVDCLHRCWRQGKG